MHQLGVILYTGSLLESVGKEEDVWEDVGDRNQPLQLQLLNRLHLLFYRKPLPQQFKPIRFFRDSSFLAS
jgi:hypothetical protein